jgi:superfamily II DNA or RNA helicase
MKLILENPAKLRILDLSYSDKTTLVRMLTYTDKTVEDEIKRLKFNPWFLNRYGEAAFAEEMERLKAGLKKCILLEDEDGYYTLSGLKDKIMGFFPTAEFENMVSYPEFKLIPWQKQPTFAPKDYQQKGVDLLIANPHSNIEFATGVGKAHIGVMLIKSTGLPTILSTPSIGLSKSAYKDLCEYFGKKNVGMFGGGKKELGKHILVCVNKSLSMVHPDDFHKFSKYQVFISDESHTTPSNTNEYFITGLLKHVPYRWFMSATQERGDGRDIILDGVIGKTVMTYSIRQAIDEGHLAKLSTMVFDVNSDSNYYSQSNRVKMNQEHVYNNKNILDIISSVVPDALSNGIQTLILVDEHAQEELLRSKMGGQYVYARSGSDTDQICRDFNDSKIMCVVGTKAISTGTNFKKNQLTVNWTSGSGSTKTKQGAIGRSTRLDEESGKTECRIMDFRVVNKPSLKRQADARIRQYKNVGTVEIVNCAGGTDGQ